MIAATTAPEICIHWRLRAVSFAWSSVAGTRSSKVSCVVLYAAWYACSEKNARASSLRCDESDSLRSRLSASFFASGFFSSFFASAFFSSGFFSSFFASARAAAACASAIDSAAGFAGSGFGSSAFASPSAAFAGASLWRGSKKLRSSFFSSFAASPSAGGVVVRSRSPWASRSALTSASAGFSSRGVGCAPLASLVWAGASADGTGRWITLPSTRTPASTGASARATAVAAGCATVGSRVGAADGAADGGAERGGDESCLPLFRFPFCFDT
ncbi:MAG: hypothetical protein U0324_05015 [Polyangiales bacterium]